jgi:hypothetical protein
MGRIQKRKTNLSKSSLSACNARPVHTDGPIAEVATEALSNVAGGAAGMMRASHEIHLAAPKIPLSRPSAA